MNVMSSEFTMGTECKAASPHVPNVFVTHYICITHKEYIHIHYSLNMYIHGKYMYVWVMNI